MNEGLKEKIIKLRLAGKTYNEIVEKLKCSKSVVSYHSTNNGVEDIGYNNIKISNDTINEINKYYLTHTVVETAKHFKLSTPTIIKYTVNKRKILTKEERKNRNVKAVRERRRKLKLMAVEYKGGCCENKKCGYNKCVDVLEFHHLDPNEKDFGIASDGLTRSWEKIKEELDKCIMLCANCHREEHSKLNSEVA